MQTPSVGRIVHYVSYGTPGGEYRSECRAAIITAIPSIQIDQFGGVPKEPIVDLCVLSPAGTLFTFGCDHHEGDIGADAAGVEITGRSYRGGTWHWPERIGDSEQGVKPAGDELAQ